MGEKVVLSHIFLQKGMNYMIVKVTEKNAQKYRALFDKASIYLGCKYIDEDKTILDINDENYINDIYEYFQSLDEIIEKSEVANDKKWKYFTMIPLPGEENFDLEPTIKVNANTRAITIPPALKSFGVVGDVIAEIVFFEIDRFFDTIDFGDESIQASIEWKRGTEEHISKAYIKELTMETGKVLIGWPITKEITEEAGIIEFSLHLYQSNGTNVVYSFSTLTGKAMINNTLNLYPEEVSTFDEDPENSIKERLKAMWGPGIIEGGIANPPVWEINIENNVDVVPYALDDGAYYADLGEVLEGVDSNTYTVRVKANSVNASGNITYKWFKYDIATGWVAVSNIDGTYSDNSTIADASEAVGGNVCKLTLVGTYKCVATDNLSKGFIDTKSSSQVLYILPPEKPIVKVCNNTEIGYNRAFLNTENVESLTVDKNGDKWYDNTYDKNNKTNVSFQWTYSNEGSNEFIDIEGATSDTYLPSLEGYYHGHAITTRNGISKRSDMGTTYRVTNITVGPSLNEYSLDGFTDIESYKTNMQNTIKVIFGVDKDGNRYKFDKIKYQWYKAINAGLNGEYMPVGETGYLDYFTVDENGNYPTISFNAPESNLYALYIIGVRNGMDSVAQAVGVETQFITDNNAIVSIGDIPGTRIPLNSGTHIRVEK